MKIKIIASGSSGNCYHIYDGISALLIECGLPIKKIKEGCNFDFTRVKGCLLSHQHMDHALSAEKIMLIGVDLYTSEETATALNLDSHRLHFIKPFRGEKIGTFEVFPFDVHHDVPTLGFLIYSYATKEKLLFITDSAYTNYKFPGLDYIMVEANHSEEAISGEEDAHRLRRSHMSIESFVKMLQANDLSTVKEIWLLHLSSRFGDSTEFKNIVVEETGCPTFIA